jgi:subtilase family serine protease
MNTILKRVAALVLLASVAFNVVPSHAYPVQPDLAPATIGTSIYGYLSVTISNLGTGNSEPCEVRVWEFGQVKVLSIPGIAAGTTRTFTTSLKSMPGQTVLVTADWTSMVAESNETNNTRSFQAAL